jgi:DNA-binding response OmpR family regulator
MPEGGNKTGPRVSGPDNSARMPIVLIDDEPMLTATLADILEEQGYQVFAAADGPAGLALFERVRPALVFLDLNMPGMHGEEVCRRLLARPSPPAVVIVTGVATDEQVERLRQLGARAVLYKPVAVSRLLDIAASIFRSRAGG